MISINNQLFNKFKDLLQLIKVNKSLSEIQSIISRNNSVLFESIECKNNYYFDINFNFAKTKLKINNNLEKNKIQTNKLKVIKCFWPKCDYKTKYLNHLRGHQSIHKNIKKYKCFWPKCEFKTKRLSHLREHQLIHKNYKQFKCNFNNCNKIFTQNSSLKVHKWALFRQ